METSRQIAADHVTPPNLRKAFSIAEAAEAAGVSRSTIKAQIVQGRLRITRLGRRVLIPAGELDRLLAAN